MTSAGRDAFTLIPRCSPTCRSGSCSATGQIPELVWPQLVHACLELHPCCITCQELHLCCIACLELHPCCIACLELHPCCIVCLELHPCCIACLELHPCCIACCVYCIYSAAGVRSFGNVHSQFRLLELSQRSFVYIQ